MERLLTPLLMKYGRKYFKSWPDIKLSLWGGDVKLSNLEMNTAVVEKEFSLPVHVLSATIRELRIHVPWTALTSAPVEIFITSLEIHVAAKAKNDSIVVPPPEIQEKIDEEVSEEEAAVDLLGGWIDQILANISIRVENLVLKYQSGDVIVSVSSKLLEMVSSSSHPIWAKQFVDPGQYGLICKSFELSDIVVHLAEVDQSEKIDPLVKCESILARTMFYMLPEQGPAEVQAVKPRVDFHLKKTLTFNITEKHVAILWKLLGAASSTAQGLKSSGQSPKKPQTPKPKPKQKKQQQLQQQQQVQQQQQQQQQGWVSWAWGMVVEDQQLEQASGPSITSVSLGDVFSTCQISLFIESLQVNLVPKNSRIPAATLNILACALLLETSSASPGRQEIHFGVQVLDLSSFKDGGLIVLASTYVPHSYFPLTLFDPKFFETTEIDPWKHFDAFRGKFVQESDSSARSALSVVVGDIVFTYNAGAWEKLIEFAKFRENSQSTAARPTGPSIHKYATPAIILAMIEAVWTNSPPPTVDISLKHVSLVLPISEKHTPHLPQALTARLSNVSVSNNSSVPKKASDGSTNWKDFMYNQYSVFVDDFNVCIDQEFLIEPFSATLQFSTHLVTDSSLLPFEFPALTASCSFPRLNLSVSPFQYVLLTRLAANILAPQLPNIVIPDTGKIKLQLQGFNLLYERNHTYYKLEGGLASMSILDVSENSVRPIGVTVDTICFPSPSRERRLCSYSIRLPVSPDAAMPRAPSPHCPAISVKFSGFALSVDTRTFLPFVNLPQENVHAEVASPEPSVPPLHAMWGSFVTSGIQLDLQLECISAFLPYSTSDALHLHISRLNCLGTSAPTPLLKVRADGVSLALIDNFPFHLTRPHNTANSAKILADFDADFSLSHLNDPSSGSTLELSTNFTKPLLLEANKTQLDTIAVIVVNLLRELDSPGKANESATLPAPLVGYFTRSVYRIPQVTTKLFVDNNEDFVTLKLANLESSVTEGSGVTKNVLTLNHVSLEFSEFAEVLGPAWKVFRGNMISFPNKKQNEPFLRFEQVSNEGINQSLSVSACDTEIVCVVPILVKLINLGISLSSHFVSDAAHQQSSPRSPGAEHNIALDIGTLRLCVPYPTSRQPSALPILPSEIPQPPPAYSLPTDSPHTSPNTSLPSPDLLHIISLNIASIKTSKPAADILQLVASLLSLESASFKSTEEQEGNAGNKFVRWTDNLTNQETVLVPTNLMTDVQFEPNGKKNISLVVEALNFAISKQVYHHITTLVAWSTSFFVTITSTNAQQDERPSPQELQFTALLGIVEIALKSHSDTETFDLLLASENIQSTYSVSGSGAAILDNKIGSVLLKSTHVVGGVSSSRNMLSPTPTAIREEVLISIYSVNEPAQQATTVDIRPLSISVHENDLRKVVDFFTPEKSAASETPAILTTTDVIPSTHESTPVTHDATQAPPLSASNNALIKNNEAKPSKTKVIVEALEVNLATGSHEAGNAVRLHARQLFFAAQPFKAGVIEGTQYDLTIVDLHGAIVKRGHPFHVLGPASAQISMLSTLPTFSLAIDIPLLPGHVNLPHINNIVELYNSFYGVFSAGDEPQEEGVEPLHTWTYNDLRLGQLRFIEERDIRPHSGEITFSRDEARLPWMSWRYAEPRAIGKISVMTPPSIGSLRNERGYKCMLSYWDELHQEFAEILRFTLSDNTQPIVLAQQIFAYEYRVSVTSSISGISSPTTLAVSLSVDSFSSPARVPSFTCNVLCSVADLGIMRPIPGSVEELYMLHLDKFVFRMTSWKQLSAMKFYTSSSLSLDYHDHSNMNLVPLIEPFLLKLSMEKQLKSSPKPNINPPLLLSSHAQSTPMTSPAHSPSLENSPVTSWTANLQAQPIEINASVDAVSHITKSIWEFQNSEPASAPELYFRYAFENMTNEDLYFGQAGTDEGIFLPSKQHVLYSWRSKVNQDLIDVWFAGSQRFGKPLNIFITGLKQCRITYKGWDVSSWILVEDKDLRTKISIYGTHKLTNWLPFPLEVKIDLFPDQVHVLQTESSCGFFCPDNHVSHISLRLGPEWKWSIPVPLAQNSPVLVEITPETPSPTSSPIHLWFQVNKSIDGGSLVSFWPIFFFKNRSSQKLEFSASTSQDVGVVKGEIPIGKIEQSTTKSKSRNLFAVPLAMSPRKNIAFCFRTLQNAEKSTWSDPPIVVGPRSITEGRPNVPRNLEISQHLVSMNGNEFTRMNVKVKAMTRSPSICVSFSFPCELRNESDFPIYFSPKVTKGNERSPLVIPVGPAQAVPFDHNMKSNNLDFSRIFIGVDCPPVGVTWTAKAVSTASKAQAVDASIVSESGDKTRVFKFVCVVDPQKHTNRICIRPSFVIANQTGLALKLHCGESDVVALGEKGTSTHLVSWLTSQKKFIDFPQLRITTGDSLAPNGHIIDVSQNLSQARFSAPDLRTLVTYATSHSELTGVTTVVLFHDTHPPVLFYNELDVPVTYSFAEPLKGKTDEPPGRVLEPGAREHEDSWDYEGFTEANDKNASSRLIPPPLMVRVQDSESIGIDVVHDLHLSLVFNTILPEGETMRKIWVTVEVKGCTRFVYFRSYDVTATKSEQPTPTTTEWHITASLAEIGVSLLEYSMNPKVMPPPSPKPALGQATNPQSTSSQSTPSNSGQSENLLVNASLRESLHVTLDGVQVRVETFAEEMSVVACADSIQVDNYIPDFEFQVILAPLRDLTKTNAQIQPTIDLFLNMATGENSHLRDAAISIKPMVLNLEDRHLLYISAVAAKIVDSVYVPTTEDKGIVEKTDKGRFETTQEFLAEITEAPFYIAKLRINPISLHLTLHATVGIFLGIQHTHIPLPMVSLEKILATKRSLMEYLLAHYMAAGVLRGAAAVLSLELLGNPGGLIQEIWAGVRDALTLPLTGLARGSPTEFVDGVRGGTLSLVRHISHGTLGSVHVLSDALSRNLLQISMDSGLLANNWEAHQDRGGIRRGVTKGLYSFGYGIWSGLTGIVTEPVKGYMSEDSGIVIGVGKGLVGAITKPVLGFTELVAHTTGGILHTTSLSYMPARRRVVKPALVTTASWTKVRTQFMSKDEEYVSHVLGAFITPNSTYTQCILLITTKRMIIIDNNTEETRRTIATDSVQRIEEEKDKSNVILHTPDVQICVQIVNASRKVAFVQALLNGMKK
eukprot:Phypoly_transcript_00024.p1 GENE.Phypoly_transcript_00024~~Phypoly_transcript_00024.p1  ORF type:complete len:3164 (+),score=487.99 Phypoly_transcript_00024:116-9607(+)